MRFDSSVTGLINKSIMTQKTYYVVNLKVQNSEMVVHNYYYDWMDVLGHLGGIFFLLQTLCYFFTPFFVLFFLKSIAAIIKAKYARMLREEINALAAKSSA